jgi:ribose/xylose/arabinose/galactoside ABC-type transport system permease subunit
MQLGGSKLNKSLFKMQETGVGLALILLVVIFSLTSPDFFSLENLLNITRQVSVITILAIAMTFVIISGGIDLSVGSNLAFVGVVTASVMVNQQISPLGASLIGISLGIGIGIINGVLIAYLKMNPFITTLGTMTAFRGLTLLFTDGYPVYGLPKGFSSIGQGYIFGIPIPSVILVIVAVLAMVVLGRTRFGRHIYAIGGNEEGAVFSGIRVSRNKLFVYSISGLLCGLAAVIQTSRIGSGVPNIGSGYELDAIAAVIIGGAALSGGSGTVLGTVLGAAVLGTLSNGLSLLNVSPFIMQIISGTVILLAVLLDNIRTNISRRSAIAQSKQTFIRGNIE